MAGLIGPLRWWWGSPPGPCRFAGNGAGLLLSVLLLLQAAAGNAATRHALLIGVGNYDNPVSALLAPSFDVSAVEQTLVEQWGFERDRIFKLLDGEASKKGIIDALRQLEVVSEEGDFIFIYYAGHGTSALDVNVAAALPHTSGALIPADFDKHGSPQEISNSLVVGRRDIRPILENLDRNGRTVFVAVDACYSGNTVRGANSALTGRPPLRVRSADLLPAGTETRQRPAKQGGKDPYPYREVFYLSAAGEHEPAGEIDDQLLKWYPTFDGKPHGAFTDALLRAMKGLTPGTDANGDGNITYLELFNAVRGFMDERGYQQSPQFLPTIDEAQVDLTQQILFDAPGAIEALAQQPRARPVRLRLIGPNASDQQLADNIEQLELVETDADLILLRDNEGARLVNAAGDIILRDSDAGSDAAWERIRSEVWLRLLESVAADRQQALITLQFMEDAMGATAVRGDDVGFSVQADRAGYLLVFNLNAQGGISLIYPSTEGEARRVAAREVVSVPGIEVVPPFGVDRIVAVSYRSPLAGIKRYFFQTMEPGQEDLERFKQMLVARADILAMVQVQMITAESANRAARGSRGKAGESDD
ncbi:MAG: caspase family protein [Xanthomonadales bacterium]|nr:caspase family protein [Xanthomonadales bacterium]